MADDWLDEARTSNDTDAAAYTEVVSGLLDDHPYLRASLALFVDLVRREPSIRMSTIVVINCLSTFVVVTCLSSSADRSIMSTNADTKAPPGEETAMSETPVGDWQRLGTALRDARLQQGLTQQALADRAGVSRAWLARFETGHRRAEVEHVFRLLAALGLSLNLRPITRTSGEAAALAALQTRR